MEWCLEKNLQTYCDEACKNKLEVLILNNASEDRTAEIAQTFCKKYPEIFILHNRDSRGYGSSINEALSCAKGTYFRIIDADDWVDTKELVRLLARLESCQADVVQTNYTVVDMQSGKKLPQQACADGLQYETVYTDFKYALHTLPAIHSTTYRTELLRKNNFFMQDKTFFVDEEYIVLPFLYAKNMVYYPENVYQYQVANPEQSTSPKNRGKYAQHRERVIKRLISELENIRHQNIQLTPSAWEYAQKRISSGIADHFTTLYIYVEDRRQGRKWASNWQLYVLQHKDFVIPRRKCVCLLLLNLFGVDPKKYMFLKKIFV